MSSETLNTAGAFSQAKDLRNRIIFTILLLTIYRLGTYVPLAGIDPLALKEIMASSQKGLLGMFNMFSGGAVTRMAIFALGIMPYISSSIIVQLLTGVSDYFKNLKEQGEIGRKKITQITRYGTVLIACLQGYGVSVGLENAGNLVIDPGMSFRIITTISLVAGTTFLMWLGEQITLRGVGNGISLIIFSGIVAEIPRALASTFELGRTGALSAVMIVGIFVLVILTVLFIVFFERAMRKILINYPKRQVGNKMYGGESSHLPLKINTAGVIPAIFASALLLLPVTISNFGFAESDAFLKISGTKVISLAFTSLGPFISKIIFLVPDDDDFIAKFFTFNTMSVTSSLTPFIDENSWRTPSIWIAVTAAPWIDDSKILLNEFPIVWPKPFSKGSAIMFATVLSSLLVIFNLLGLIRAFQFLSIIFVVVCIILSFFLVV